MNWITALIIGGVIGWLASILMKTNAQMGVVANVVVGILGSMLGFWIAGQLGIAPLNTLFRFMVALGGAVLLIYILSKFGILQKK